MMNVVLHQVSLRIRKTSCNTVAHAGKSLSPETQKHESSELGGEKLLFSACTKGGVTFRHTQTGVDSRSMQLP